MTADVVRATLRERRRSIAWWAAGTVALVAVTLAVYPSVRDSAGLSDYAENLPDAMRALFAGGQSEISSGPGYLQSQVFGAMAPLLVLIFAISAGAAAVAGEEERGTLELLLATPLTRAGLVMQKFAAAALSVLCLSAVLLASVAVASATFGLDVALAKLVFATIGVALLGLVFAAAALAAGSLWPGRGRALAIAGGIAFAAWMLDGLGQVVESLDPLRPLSPYYQAVGTNPVREGAVPWSWAVLAATAGALVLLAVAGLRRRDIRG